MGHVVRIDVCHSPVNLILNLSNMWCVSLVYPKMTGNEAMPYHTVRVNCHLYGVHGGTVGFLWFETVFNPLLLIRSCATGNIKALQWSTWSLMYRNENEKKKNGPRKSVVQTTLSQFSLPNWIKFQMNFLCISCELVYQVVFSCYLQKGNKYSYPLFFCSFSISLTTVKRE